MNVLKQLGRTFLSGFLVIAPVYLTVLLLLHGIETVRNLLKPVLSLLPQWFPSEAAISIGVVLLTCFLLGLLVRTGLGKLCREWIEARFLNRIPGYSQIRALTQQIAGESQQNTWKPALIDMDGAYVHGFLIEECNEHLVVVFVPGVPSIVTGNVYILKRERVHLLNVPFSAAFKSISHWGAGAKELVAAMHAAQRAEGKLEGSSTTKP